MKKILPIFALLLSVSAFSQKNQIQVTAHEKVIGKSLIDNYDIKGRVYTFPERVHESFLDTTTGLLTIQLRGLSSNGKWLENKGNIVQYDLKNNKVLWSKKIAYQVDNLQQFSRTMIYTAGNKSFCLDVHSGKELWEVKNNIYYVDPYFNIGLGYRFKTSTGYTNELEGIDLKNGNVIWNRPLTREYGWNDVFYLDDSTLVVAAAGLHSINARTGKGWDYFAETAVKDYKRTAAENVAGAAVGMLTGTFYMSTGYDLVRDLVSNILADSTSIYIASKEQLAKINKQSGSIVWRSVFPDEIGSKSSILMNDSSILMINKGMAYMGMRQLDFGKPFIAEFDRQTGKKKFMTLIDVKDDPVLSYQICNDEICLVFKNRIIKYSVNSGDKISEKEFPKESFGELKYFIGSQVYVTNQAGDLVSLSQSDTSKIFVFTGQGKILSIDSSLNVSGTTGVDDLYIYYYRMKDHKFIAKENKTFIIDQQGKRIAEIDATKEAFIIGETLYDKYENSFISFDLKGIVNDE